MFCFVLVVFSFFCFFPISWRPLTAATIKLLPRDLGQALVGNAFNLGVLFVLYSSNLQEGYGDTD